MIKSQNTNIRNKKSQGNMTPQKFKNHTIRDLEVRRMITRMFKVLKEDLQKQLSEFQENTYNRKSRRHRPTK
jgi:hypothetical protein